ncbi:MAG: dienelactone hydrolase family protein [Pseudomonadota bacterium]
MSPIFSNSRNYIFLAIIISVCAAVVFLSSFLYTPYVTKKIVYTTNENSDGEPESSISVDAKLYFPKDAQFPLSLVIIVPSSGGIEAEREIYYATEFAKVGIASLLIDSFQSRGLTNSLYDQSQLETWQIEKDAYAALRYILQDKRFKSDKIAITGVSKGGTVAMDTALLVRKGWAGIGDINFSAHIAISPDCNWVTSSNKTTGKPVLFLLAELDDQTPPEACLQKAKAMHQGGNKAIETKVYEDAHHAWEELGWYPDYDPNIENYAKCRVSIEDDGTMIAAETGESVPEDDWHTWAKQNCMTLGGKCCGGSRQLKKQATRDIIEFLQKHGF